MKKLNPLKPVIFLILFVSILVSCDQDEKQMARISVVLIDAPASYEAVLIDIREVRVHISDDQSMEDGWQTLEGTTPGIYDLLQLTNGEEAYLGDVELPAGQLGQVRLILGPENHLVINGEKTTLSTPSAMQSGLKVKVSEVIEGGITYKLVLDFDAAKSIVKAGNSGKHNLKPVIRGKLEALTGGIQGVVNPSDIPAVIYAIQGDDSIATFADETGEYLIRALSEGTYNVTAIPEENSGFQQATIENVNVVTGAITRADTLFLPSE